MSQVDSQDPDDLIIIEGIMYLLPEGTCIMLHRPLLVHQLHHKKSIRITTFYAGFCTNISQHP